MSEPKDSPEPEPPRCSFCGQTDVRPMVAGPGTVCICAECVDMANEMVVLERALGPEWAEIATLIKERASTRRLAAFLDCLDREADTEEPDEREARARREAERHGVCPVRNRWGHPTRHFPDESASPFLGIKRGAGTMIDVRVCSKCRALYAPLPLETPDAK